jgi:hypothetical protein
MRQKLIVFSILAVVGLAVLAVAGVTVYALGFGQNEVIVQPEKVEAAPVQAAPAVIQAGKLSTKAIAMAPVAVAHTQPRCR